MVQQIAQEGDDVSRREREQKGRQVKKNREKIKTHYNRSQIPLFGFLSLTTVGEAVSPRSRVGPTSVLLPPFSSIQLISK
jgi:hypothetical protein